MTGRAAVLAWVDRKEAETRSWAQKHNPACECDVAPTTYDLLSELRRLLSAGARTSSSEGPVA